MELDRAGSRTDFELACDSLRYVEPVQLGVQQPRQAPVELVGTVKDAAAALSALVSRDLNLVHLPVRCCSSRHVM